MKTDLRTARGMAMLGKYIGKRYSRLVVIGIGSPDKSNHKLLVCVCDCGNITHCEGHKLKIGKVKSCGCWNREYKRRGNVKHSQCLDRIKSPEYESWSSMKTRCFNPKRQDYKWYGGRGIGVDSAWLNFSVFLRDMGKKPSNKHTIERIDNSKGYGPDNCKWATQSEQSVNKRTNKLLNLHGRILTLSQWEKETGIGRGTITSRLKLGWTIESALTKEVR